MRKRIGIIFGMILAVLLLSGCSASVFFSLEGPEDGFHYGVNRRAGYCFVGPYEVEDIEKNSEITIPDTFDGLPVTVLGGFFGTGVPTPFTINMENAVMNADSGSVFNSVYGLDVVNYEIPAKYTVEEVVFTLNIGKNLREVKYVEPERLYPHINDDESVTFYCPVVEVHCSVENENFYSQDGKLYRKADGSLVEELAYKGVTHEN